jgi:hypothetical protein
MGEMVLPLTLVHDHHPGLANNLDIEGTLRREKVMVVQGYKQAAQLDQEYKDQFIIMEEHFNQEWQKGWSLVLPWRSTNPLRNFWKVRGKRKNPYTGR